MVNYNVVDDDDSIGLLYVGMIQRYSIIFKFNLTNSVIIQNFLSFKLKLFSIYLNKGVIVNYFLRFDCNNMYNDIIQIDLDSKAHTKKICFNSQSANFLLCILYSNNNIGNINFLVAP